MRKYGNFKIILFSAQHNVYRDRKNYSKKWSFKSLKLRHIFMLFIFKPFLCFPRKKYTQKCRFPCSAFQIVFSWQNLKLNFSKVWGGPAQQLLKFTKYCFMGVVLFCQSEQIFIAVMKFLFNDRKNCSPFYLKWNVFICFYF